SGAAWRRRDGWYALAVVLVLGLAVVARGLYAAPPPGYELRHDQRDYDQHALSLARGEGYSRRVAYGRPTAFRPPGYPYFLAGVYRLAGVEHAPAQERVEAARKANVVVGTLVVALIGLLAAQLWRRRVALVAMAIAAVYVPLIVVGGSVMSELLFTALVLGALVLAVEHRRSTRRRYAYAVAAGAMAGLAMLTRANAAILLVPLAIAAWDARPRWSRRALGPPLALLATALVLLVPWTVRNASQLHAFVPFTTQVGSALAGTYNDQARTDPVNPGAWRSIRHVPEYADFWAQRRTTPEAVLDRRLRATAWRYIADHPLYVAEVWWWNTRRMADLAGRERSRATAATITIDRAWADRAVTCFWVVAALALVGAAARPARRAPAWLWAVPALLYLSVVLLAVETPRYRTALDPFVILLAAVGLVAAGDRLRRRATT
ncbi:MAG: glycosyltransferase family 39 protein, partial [Solirubrobacterales bacterium]|nr:glycosyltransferase family 39 protein [Solirubrobacterales bacterium]